MTGERWAPGLVEAAKRRVYTLQAGTKAWKYAELVELGGGIVAPAAVGRGGRSIGRANRTVDATSGPQPIEVLHDDEIWGRWLENSSTDPISSLDIGEICFLEDDQTVSRTASGPVAGRVRVVRSIGPRIFVENVEQPPARLFTGPTLIFLTSDLAIRQNPVDNTAFDVPQTSAPSTITLPATAQQGTRIYFVADGTKNGHTVQYRDATGPTNLTPALAAGRKHVAELVFFNGAWFALYNVAP